MLGGTTTFTETFTTEGLSIIMPPQFRIPTLSNKPKSGFHNIELYRIFKSFSKRFVFLNRDSIIISMSKEIGRGAEAVLYLEDGKVLIKDRIAKGYRIPVLDEKIRKRRTKREAKMLKRAAGTGILVPNVQRLGKTEIRMDFIEGKTVMESFNDLTEDDQEKITCGIGDMIARLHKSGMVHGDLTTSNMILKDGKIYLIDFGLGKFSQKVEDQAVDLFLLYEALKSAHYKYLNKAWQNILKSYKQNYQDASHVLNRFEKIANRRRYK